MDRNYKQGGEIIINFGEALNPSNYVVNSDNAPIIATPPPPGLLQIVLLSKHAAKT